MSFSDFFSIRMPKNLIRYLECHNISTSNYEISVNVISQAFPRNFVIIKMSVAILNDLNRHLIKITHLTFNYRRKLISCELKFLRMQIHKFLRNSLSTKKMYVIYTTQLCSTEVFNLLYLKMVVI